MRTIGDKRGFSTLEMLIAMTIIILTLTAVTMTVFGNQSVLVDSRRSGEALAEAQSLIENAQTLARKDFALVNPTTSVRTLGGAAYQESVKVKQIDYFVKEITATVGWAGEHGRTQSVDLSTIVADFDHVSGGNTCSSVLPDHGWDIPYTENSTTDFRSLIGTSTGDNIITNIDAYKGKLYVTVGQTTYKTDPTFFVFDIAKLKNNQPALLGKLDTASNTKMGLFSLSVADGAAGGSVYAYVANEFAPTSWSCAPDLSCSQLQVIDAKNPSLLSTSTTAYLKIPGVTGTGGQGTGSSVFYKDGYVYLGLTKTASGPEFNVIDVHNPMSPQYLSGYAVGATVNAILVSGNYAYLATNDTGREIIVLDVSNPNAPTLATSYDAPGQYGYALAKKGDTLYLGRQYQSGAPELMLLDASSTTLIPSVPLQTSDVGTVASPFSINAVLARDYLSFFSGGSPSIGGRFYVQKTNGSGAVTDWAPPMALPGTSQGSAIDCEGNDIFVSSNDTLSGAGFLSVITSAP
jgi:type II secretory pathway pseudopilin PulG